MSDTRNGFESSETQPSVNDSDSTSTEKPSLHVRLSKHLETCSQCQSVIQSKSPTGFGMTGQLCSEYQDIIQEWANEEGAINNIVDHDEYGNQASKTVRERYPDQWR